MAPRSCTSSADCAPMVCDVAGSMTCVQCTAAEDEACGGATPACGSDGTCRGCTAHAECDSGACLPDGSCGDDANVAYVDPAGTDNASCTRAMPCTLVGKALATGRPYVKLTGTTDEAVTVDNDRDVAFLADPMARLTRTNGAGAILTVRDDGTTLTIYDLAIGDAPNSPSGIGIVIPPAAGAPTVALVRATVTNNPGGGISASGGTLAVTRSTISLNEGGGITVMNGVFVIVGNVFFANGSQDATIGGIAISTTLNANNRIEFNSFSRNAATDGFASAMQCMVGGSFVARNNIMSDNGTLSNQEQVSGNCMHTHSIIRPGTTPQGPGNSAFDPLFQNAAMGDLHLKPGSPAIRRADPNSNLLGAAERDIDGDVRTAPADMGADEVP